MESGLLTGIAAGLWVMLFFIYWKLMVIVTLLETIANAQ